MTGDRLIILEFPRRLLENVGKAASFCPTCGGCAPTPRFKKALSGSAFALVGGSLLNVPSDAEVLRADISVMRDSYLFSIRHDAFPPREAGAEIPLSTVAKILLLDWDNDV